MAEKDALCCGYTILSGVPHGSVLRDESAILSLKSNLFKD